MNDICTKICLIIKWYAIKWYTNFFINHIWYYICMISFCIRYESTLYVIGALVPFLEKVKMPFSSNMYKFGSRVFFFRETETKWSTWRSYKPLAAPRASSWRRRRGALPIQNVFHFRQQWILNSPMLASRARFCIFFAVSSRLQGLTNFRKCIHWSKCSFEFMYVHCIMISYQVWCIKQKPASIYCRFPIMYASSSSSGRCRSKL
jgi:hypothetical protein